LPQSINFNNRTPLPASNDPAAIADSYILYIKEDAKANMFGDRVSIWRVATTDIMSHPIMGWGLDSYRRKTTSKQFMYFTKPNSTEAAKVKYNESFR